MEQGRVQAVATGRGAGRPGARDEGLGVELALLWRGELRDVRLVRHAGTVAIGESKDAALFVPSERLGTARYPLLARHGAGFAVNLSNRALGGSVLLGERLHTVDELRASGQLVDGDGLPLGVDTRCRLTLGDLTLLVSATTLPARVRGRRVRDLGQSAYTGLSVLLHLLLLVPLGLSPEAALVAQRDPHHREERAHRVTRFATPERPQPAEALPAEPEATVEDPSAPATTAAAAPLPDRPRPARNVVASGLAPAHRRARNDVRPTNVGAAAAISRNTALWQDLTRDPAAGWGTRGLGDRLAAAGGGDAPGGFGDNGPFAYGPGGGGFTGPPGLPGGPGGGLETVDIVGLRKPAGVEARIDLPSRPVSGVVVAKREGVEVTGVDGALIQRHIRAHVAEVRWCYRNALQGDRSLAGTVTIEFVILASGAVAKPAIGKTTMHHAELEQCIVQKVARWRFPPLATGGVARVRYPFVLRSM